MELRLLFLVLELGQAIYFMLFSGHICGKYRYLSAGINKSNALTQKILVFPLLNILRPHFSFVSLARAIQIEGCITRGSKCCTGFT
jgi:hypothetical protein